MLLVSVYLTWDRTVCGDELANTGDRGVVRVCRTIAVTDPAVLGSLLLILLLLLPDLSEIGIPGFLSLKRQVREQEWKLGEQEARLAALHAQIEQTIGLQQTATQDVDTRANALSVNVLDIAGVLQRFEASAQLDLPAAANEGNRSANAIPPARAQLESRLLRVWAQLEPHVSYRDDVVAKRSEVLARQDHLNVQHARLKDHLARRTHAGKDPATADADDIRTANEAAVLRRDIVFAEQALDSVVAELNVLEHSPVWKWNADFGQEIQIVQVARDALVHGESIEDSKLSAAVRLAEGLVEAWRSRSGATPEAGAGAVD